MRSIWNLKYHFLKACDWATKPKRRAVNAVFFTFDEKGKPTHYLFQTPSADQVKKAGNGLRLIGGMDKTGTKKETNLQILEREALEEIIGFQNAKSFYETGDNVHLNQDQKRAVQIVKQAIGSVLKGDAPIKLPSSFVHDFWPNRNNPEQDTWVRARTTIVSIPVENKEGLEHLAKVSCQTAELENIAHAEINSASVISRDEIIERLKLAKEFVFRNERDAFVAHLRHFGFNVPVREPQNVFIP